MEDAPLPDTANYFDLDVTATDGTKESYDLVILRGVKGLQSVTVNKIPAIKNAKPINKGGVDYDLYEVTVADLDALAEVSIVANNTASTVEAGNVGGTLTDQGKSAWYVAGYRLNTVTTTPVAYA